MENHALDILKQEFLDRRFDLKENVHFRVGKKMYVLNMYLKSNNIGVVSLIWNRTLPTNKLIQLEGLMNTLELKKLVVVCSSISDNARDYLARRDVGIEVLCTNEILNSTVDIDSFVAR